MENTSEDRQNITDKYRESLEKTFNKYLKNEIKGQPERILSIGCSFGYEAGAISRIFPTAKYLGIDIDKNLIEAAQSNNEDVDNAEFRVGDARETETFGNEPWDMILIRHPQVLGTVLKASNLEKDWNIIFKNSLKALKKEGLLFVSTKLEEERDRVLQYVNSSEEKMEILTNSKNEFSTKIGSFNDNFIIISKKSGN
jgi:SAM-dependent methyltransferase